MRKGFVMTLLAGCLLALAAAPSVLPESSQGLPPGFAMSEFATGLSAPRFMARGADGVLYVSSLRGFVYALPDRDHDGKADQVVTFAEGLRRPHGVAWRDGWLYVGETHRVVRLRDTDGDGVSDQQEEVAGGLPPGGQHFTRTIGFGPDGALYVAAGSSCNVCEEEHPLRAAIGRWNTETEQWEVYARGLRNSVGFTWHPETGEMWAVNNGRDWLGDDLPPEELNLIQQGGDYGWPYCYGDRIPDPDMGSEERCQDTLPPAFTLPAHSAPLGLCFYTGAMFPDEYRGDLLVALHGSWNRSVPTGYKVVRVRFKDGQPVRVEDFIDVWYTGQPSRSQRAGVSMPRVSHRPVDVLVGADGSLYISSDRGGAIFRVTYQQ